ncbi:hypothetical protein AcV7_009599 [Taiwanofungus camphoratus]|nr:hypothetical protein AcV7_009599 [Antrodia cinnamomea]
MISDPDWDDSDGEVYVTRHSNYQRKRRRLDKRSLSRINSPGLSSLFAPLFDVLTERPVSSELQDKSGGSFDGFFQELLPELQEAKVKMQEQLTERDAQGNCYVWPIAREEARLLNEQQGEAGSNRSMASLIMTRKLTSLPSMLRRELLGGNAAHILNNPTMPLSAKRPAGAVNSQVIDVLCSMQTIHYQWSFLSRLLGFQPSTTSGAIAVDWETRSPWMQLMSDIREHFMLAHPDREQPEENVAPIEYVSLHSGHLTQVHDILSRAFWEGINVSDSLQHSPDKCTVIATYKRLVVGVALLSSPQETYITYLAVRAGWENAQIATTMLYHLIALNPTKDITLHVSINNPAMLLYNRFGFKAEELVVGFYEDYLDPQLRASKNAFRLRLRR